MPHQAHNRRIGEVASIKADPTGQILSEAEWAARVDEFLPTPDDAAYITGLMQPVHGAGDYASWIAPPKAGIDGKPGDFEYVQIHE